MRFLQSLVALAALSPSSFSLISAAATPASPASPPSLQRQLRRVAHKLASAPAAAPAAEAAAQPVKRDEEPPKDWKYFNEPGGDDHLGHYDVRYFKGLVEYDEHHPMLRHLIRSYLLTFNKYGVETWLAHGTLLGWWWNGKIMPWDYDLDVQVSSPTLYWLGQHLNRTEHAYEYEDADGVARNKTYMLDVNPHHAMRDRGDGQNVIDARWIDLSNGMFIDITGLAEREPDKAPGIWSCKNFHRYRTTDLYPMRMSEFEGVPATVPYSFERILTEEYGTKSLVITEWLGHRWEPDVKEWVKLPEHPSEAEKKLEKKEPGHKLEQKQRRSPPPANHPA